MDHLLARTDIDTSRLFVQGCSLGGAVAISLLTKNKYGTQLCGAMLENTFVGISEMVDQLFPLLRPIKRHILKIHWPSRRRLEANCPCPVLLLSGRRDEVVPCSHMDLLIIAANAGADAFAASEAGSAFPKPKNQFIEIADGTHNDTWMKGAQAFFPAASAFMIEQVKVRSPIIAAAQRKAAGN
jgi:alpha-beta hydrolase superfamily lysophospholipase